MRHCVLLADLAVTAADLKLATTEIAQDLPGAVNGV